MLVMAGHSSLQSLTWQLAITQETSSEKFGGGETVAKLSRSSASCRMPRSFNRRAVRSYFGVTPSRKVGG